MKQGIHLQFPLRVAVQMWPTPGQGIPVATPHSQMWLTPTKADGTSGPGQAETCQGGKNLRTAIGGLMNPTWVEWLMGWPLGWTDLRASAMDKFQQWRRSHGVV